MNDRIKRCGGLIVLLLASCAVLPARAATRTWTPAGADLYWTNALNWSGSAEPGPGDTAQFGTTNGATSSGFAGQTTCTVDVSRTVADLNFNLNSGGGIPPSSAWNHGIQLNSGVALTVTSNFNGVGIGDGSLTFKGTSLTIGSGTNSTFDLGCNNNNNWIITCYMTNLSTFTVNVGSFDVRAKNTGGNTPGGILYLAATNRITASGFNLGNWTGNGGHGDAYLGQTNEIAASTILLALRQATATLQFRSGLSGTPTLKIRGMDGTSRLPGMTLGAPDAGSGTANATMDLITNTTGSVDALVDTLYVGRAFTNSANGTMRWAAGTVDATTVVLGSATNNAVGTGTGTMSLSGNAILMAGTLTLTHNQSTNGTAAASGTLTLTNSALVKAGLIQKGTGTTAVVRWNSGTIKNAAGSNLNLKALSGTLALNLAAPGPHTFYADSSQAITLESTCILTNTGAITKDGPGTLILSGTNTYSGLTDVQAGTLALGTAAALGSSSGVRLQAGAVLDTSAAGFTLGSGQTLSGNGTVTGALTAASVSTNAPGIGGIGALTNGLSGGKTATYQPGAAFNFDLGAPGAGDVIAFTGLTAGNTSVFFNNNVITFTDAGGLAEGVYTVMTFSAASAYSGTPTFAVIPHYGASYLTYSANDIELTVAAAAAPSTVWITKTADGHEEGPANGEFMVSRLNDAGTNAAVTVFYTVDASSTATGGSDYTALSGSVSMGKGETNATIPVYVLQDTNFNEGTETVVLDLSPDANYTIGNPGSATVYIADDLKPVITIQKTADGSEEGPVNGSFTVSRPSDLAAGKALTVYYSVNAASTATAGSDYNALSGSVGMGAGVTNATITIAVLKDTAFSEGPETVILDLTANTNYAAGVPGSATGTIADAVEPTVTITKTADGSEFGAINGAFSVSRQAAATGSAVTVYYTTSGSATPGSDYLALASNVTIAIGQTNAVIPVLVLRDGIYNEGTETLTLSLAANAWYFVGDPGNATMNIADDAAPGRGGKGGFAALYTFSNTVFGTVVDPTPEPYETGVRFGAFSIAGYSAGNQTAGAFYPRWTGLNVLWPVTGKYFEVALAPLPEVRMTITNISFDVATQVDGGPTMSGPKQWAIRSSLDNYTVNLQTFTSTNANITVVNGDTLKIGGGYAASAFQSGASLALDSRFTDITNSVTFRLYPFDGPGASPKSGGIDNFTICGTWTGPGAGMILLVR